MTGVPLAELSGEIDDGGYLTLAQALVAALQAENSDEVARLLDALTALRESKIYQRIGHLTREVHDSFAVFSRVILRCANEANEGNLLLPRHEEPIRSASAERADP